MAHQAIYRKWRPLNFNDIVGQEHITRTLKNQISRGTVGHAYLFCGTRGTGKTTCAKVLSRAVNCLNPKDGNPCNECEVCRGILDGSIMDVTEMDAASNNGVEDIRDIIEDINYVASNTKYTVYIIDEVHMLSTSAFNALLKTLEEPPENVVFILATTEAHKVPQTILSRCQRFDFKRIRNEDIVVRMKEIAHADGYDITDDAYRILASLAEGSMRDGLSIMERVISACGNKVSAEDITSTLGISSSDTVYSLADAIAMGDTSSVISIIDRAVSDGKELTQLASSMLSHLRSLMICKVSDKPEAMIDCDADTLVKLKAQSEKFSFERLDRASAVISQAMADARVASSSRIVYELAYIKLARPETDSSPKAVMDRLVTVETKLFTSDTPIQPVSVDNGDILRRLEAVEETLKNGVTARVEETEPEPMPEIIKTSARMFVPIPEEELNRDYPTAVLARNWEKTFDLMMRRDTPLVMPLKNCVVTFDKEGLILLVPEDRKGFTQRTAMSNIDSIRSLFKKVTNSDYTIKIIRRNEFDPRNVLNPFTLPKAEKQEQKEETASQNEAEVQKEDKLDTFFEQFESIITDGDKFALLNDTPTDPGEQSSFDDDEREEFLDEKEIMTDDEEDV
ncbi:MAG: DNA polymerase III subunit gamma/tau [Clostridiales bacterium]|nr:DNA polymerase III subunit gamma/tau [Clostridiales bacterium]